MEKFQDIYDELAKGLRQASVVETKKWQSTDANPHALRMRELQHVQVRYGIPGESLQHLSAEIQPFQPWADKHFETERVSLHPINPGTTYKEWRYPASAKEHVGFQFSHSYAERYWPKYAGQTASGIVMADEREGLDPHCGIRFEYGDLWDLVEVLRRDPYTRQAYLPIFFPEDLQASLHGERLPCTLGYHFLMRSGRLDIVYHMRSCDFVRHFRDDVYLTVRLLLWVLDRLRDHDEDWVSVTPGKFIMNISSLHCFEDDTV